MPQSKADTRNINNWMCTPSMVSTPDYQLISDGDESLPLDKHRSIALVDGVINAVFFTLIQSCGIGPSDIIHQGSRRQAVHPT